MAIYRVDDTPPVDRDSTVEKMTDAICAGLDAAGFVATVQYPFDGGHIGWLGAHRTGPGQVNGVRLVCVQDEHHPGWPHAGFIRIEDDSDHSGYHFMGYGNPHRRVGTVRWRIAEGYVNGFRKRDILWFTLTRSLPRLLRLPYRLQDRLLDDFTRSQR